MKKKIIVFILCICIISTFFLQPAYAMGAESIIVGGGAAAGLSLTMPQVAILIAAGFGLIYTVQHAEDIYGALNTSLNNAATNIENGMEQLTKWQEDSAKGLISIASAPLWIKDTINDWITGLYNSAENITVPNCIEYPAGTPFPAVDFWTSATLTSDYPCTVVRLGEAIKTSEYYDMTSYMYLITDTWHYGWDNETINGVTYNYVKYSASLSANANKPLAGNNKLAWDSISALPSITDIKNNFDGNSVDYKVISAFASGYLGALSLGICPDETVQGIDDAIGTHGIDNIKMPDLDIGGSKLLTPDVAGGSIDNVLDNTLTGIKNKEITWEKFMDDVAVGNPSVSIPVEGEGVKDFPITDTGVSDIPIDTPIPDNPAIPGNPSVEVPEGLQPFTISSITDFFPFCIPFDIVDFVNVLCAEPEAPKFEWKFTWYDGSNDTLTIDLSAFDSVAQILRNMELLLFCVGLAMITRNQIRG